MIPRLKDHYDKVIVANLQNKFAMKNKLMVPKVLKIVLNMGLGADANDKKKTSKLYRRYVADQWSKTSCNKV